MNDQDYRIPSIFPGISMPSAFEAEPVDPVEDFVPTVAKAPDEEFDELPSFDLNKFQVVRREFFSHIGEPSIAFCNYKIGLNMACIKRLPDTDYIQFLVNRQTKTLAVRPCRETDLHSFQWCTNSGGKRKPRQVTGKMFFMKIFTMMDWNPDYRYKILGKLIKANGQYLFVFDLTATEMYRRIVKDGEKVQTSRVPVFPTEWQDQFGVPFEEHKKSLQINIFDNYAVYGLKEKESPQTEVPTPQPVQQPPAKPVTPATPAGSPTQQNGGSYAWQKP